MLKIKIKINMVATIIIIFFILYNILKIYSERFLLIEVGNKYYKYYQNT